jgi:hypothetical protein
VRSDDKNDPGGAAPPPDADELAARIRDLLHEIGHVRIAQLHELRARLQASASEWDDAAFAAAVFSLHSAWRELRFMPLRQGWIAHLLGRHRAAQARFIAAFEHIVACASRVKTHIETLADTSPDSLATMRSVLLAIGDALEQFDAAIDRGVTWLQDMCTQLADAPTAGGDGIQLARLAMLAQAAQLFTQEFKRLQSASEMAQDVALRGNTVLMRRTALLAQVRSDIRMLDETWMPRLAPVVAALGAGRNAAPAIPKAIEAHEELMKRLSAAVDACGALRHQEPLLARELEQWGQELA